MTTHQGIPPDNIKAATRIFAEHGGFIYRVIYCKLSDKSLADDIYQDFFLALCAVAVPCLEGPQLKAYLQRSIEYDILNAARRVRNYRKNMKKMSDHCKLQVHYSGPTGAYSVKEEFEELMERVWKEIPAAQKKAISLRYLQEYSNEEVAEEMGVSQESVRNYINRGLKTLRQKLAQMREAAK